MMCTLHNAGRPGIYKVLRSSIISCMTSIFPVNVILYNNFIHWCKVHTAAMTTSSSKQYFNRKHETLGVADLQEHFCI